jgi:chromosome segregation ATPase
MTAEEIERILLTVAENQARHSTEISEINGAIALLLKSQNRYEERQAALSEILHDLADKQIKTEERFADLAAAQVRFDARLEKLEDSYQLLEQFVREFRAESNGNFAENAKLFAESDRKLAELAEAQMRTDEQIRALLGRNGSK